MADDPFDALSRDAAALGLRLEADQVALCARYADALAEATKTVNLTAITERSDIAVRHFLDSFTGYAARVWSGHELVVDVGSGAGFPGLALRIALPGIAVTCIEATGKKARFIERMRDELGLSGADVINGRGEEVARDVAHRARYDVATARALGSLALCAELLLPFLRVGGDAVVWKGKTESELPAARKALAALGGEVVSVVTTSDLGLGDALPGRRLVVMRKAKPTPDRYPRTPAEMKRRPW
jgi:16S rRNA (guanine527-N7)-methyltransferase